MSKQADFHVITRGGESYRDILGDYEDFLADQGVGGATSGGGGLPWPLSQPHATVPQHSPAASQPTTSGKALGMDPVTLGLLISQIAGPMLGGLFGPDQQQRKSFEGQGAIDPSNMMRNNLALTSRLGNAITDHLATPVSLPSAVVQTPGAYTGGGLPFPIGVSAEDPALANPSLLNRPGLGEFQDLFKGLDFGDRGGIPQFTTGTPPGYGSSPGDVPAGTPGFDNFFQPGFDQGDSMASPGASAEATGPRRRSSSQEYGQLVRASDLQEGAPLGDDLTKGLGAVQLLMEAFR